MTETVVLDTQSNIVQTVDSTNSVSQTTVDTVLQDSIIRESVTVDSYTTVVAFEKVIEVIQAGQPGPPGIAEEDIVYSKRVDFISDNLLYKGEAVVGSLDTAPVWRIRQVTISSIDGDVSELWASGNANFDKVWSNRLLLAYS